MFSGIAVTNNHVVTGAALIKVWVGGESEPRNARVWASPNVADLAVIDIDGDGYPFMAWYDGNVDVGLDVCMRRAHSWQCPEYTLTRGIIAKANANGGDNWASVDVCCSMTPLSICAIPGCVGHNGWPNCGGELCGRCRC
ncbi:MAG: hypothetical protein R3E31_23385 [Chloroflexota bacterium]